MAISIPPEKMVFLSKQGPDNISYSGVCIHTVAFLWWTSSTLLVPEVKNMYFMCSFGLFYFMSDNVQSHVAAHKLCSKSGQGAGLLRKSHVKIHVNVFANMTSEARFENAC